MPTTELATRALAIGTDSAGGYAVPTVLMPGILEALVPVSSLVQAGAGILPLTDGAKTYNFAAIDTLPTAAWRAENGAVAESAPTFKNIEITPRSLSFMVKLSRELLHDARNIEQSLQQAIAQAFAIAIDRAGLMGSGTAPEPRGLKNTSGIQTVTNGAAGTVLGSYANVFSAVEKILVVNGPLPGAAIMAPRSLVKLGALADSTGQPLQVPTMLQGIKLLQTSQIPTNLVLTTSSDCSDIYVGDFTKMYVCMRENLNVQMLTEAYADYGQIAFVCHARVDFAVAYPQAFCLVSGVR
jgi:HK97 family phage major capsid protein